jgi:hypothetical protein
MKLITLHKILISFAIAFFLFFGIRETTKEDGSSILGIASIFIALGGGGYFIWVIRGGYSGKKDAE